MMRITKKGALYTGAALVIAFVAFALYVIWGIGHPPKRHRYLIPNAYAGWVCVSYLVVDAKPLPVEDGFSVVQFPPSGIVETSLEGMPGKYADEFYRYSPSGRSPLDVGREMGGGYTVAKSETPDHYTFKFWVSADARADYKKYVEDKPDDCGAFPNYQSTSASSNRPVEKDASTKSGSRPSP